MLLHASIKGVVLLCVSPEGVVLEDEIACTCCFLNWRSRGDRQDWIDALLRESAEGAVVNDETVQCCFLCQLKDLRSKDDSTPFNVLLRVSAEVGVLNDEAVQYELLCVSVSWWYVWSKTRLVNALVCFKRWACGPRPLLFEVLLCVLAKVGVESKSRLFKSCEWLFQRQLMGLWLKVKLLCVLFVSDNGIAVKDETGVFFVFQPMGLRPKTRLSDFTMLLLV